MRVYINHVYYIFATSLLLCKRERDRKEKEKNLSQLQITINTIKTAAELTRKKRMALLSMKTNGQEKDIDLSDIIYLDNNATTREDKSVIELMINHLKCSYSFGNPSSSHLFGIKAKYLIDEAREQVRSSINALNSNEIIFTSGGTESNNLAIHSILKSNLNQYQHIITSPFEHPSVANILQYFQKSHHNIEISFAKVDSNGIIDLEHFRQLIKSQTKLVTIMHSNNEIGSIQPLEEIVNLCREYGSSDLIIHSDASQSMGKVPVDVSRLGIDLLTICSHKFHGPKGIGALYIRQGIKLESILYGAQHEQGLRPGTENVLAIIGLGKACQLISNKFLLNKRIEQMKRTRDRLYYGLINQFNPNNDHFIHRNGDEQKSLPNTLSLSFRGLNAKQLVHQLTNHLAFSTGSACHEDIKHQTMSTTLQAIGLSWELARGTIRLSTSYMTTDDEIDRAIILITDGIKEQLSSYTNGHDH